MGEEDDTLTLPREPVVNETEARAGRDTKRVKVNPPEGSNNNRKDEHKTGEDVITATTDVTNLLMLSRDEMAKQEEDGGAIDFRVITNDGTPEHSEQLMTLKNIFSKQLPKMPKEYIVRLVFDRKHKSMVIVKGASEVVGGICYRPFYSQHFAEIAFCAITASEQVKGYGTRLMNHVKEYAKTEGIHHFLTYADNYAIGYFKKQGFSKQVSMAKENWMGYIKDYDGGTLMECAINLHVNYLDIPGMIQKQREFLLTNIREKSKATMVYPGLTTAFDEEENGGRIIDIFTIPGILEAGWSAQVLKGLRAGGRTREQGNLKSQLNHIYKQVSTHRSAWPFHEPVDTELVTDYLDYVSDPIDLSLMGKRLKSGDYYTSKQMLKADLERMCNNCVLYNAPDTNYYKAAIDLQHFVKEKLFPASKLHDSQQSQQHQLSSTSQPSSSS